MIYHARVKKFQFHEYFSLRANIMDRHIFQANCPLDSLKFLFRKIILYSLGTHGWKYLSRPWIITTECVHSMIDFRFLPRIFQSTYSSIFFKELPPQSATILRFYERSFSGPNNRNIPIPAYSQTISLKLPTLQIYSYSKFLLRLNDPFIRLIQSTG